MLRLLQMDNPCPETVEWPIPGFEGYLATFAGEIIDARTGRVKKQRAAGNGAMQVGIGKSTQMVHDLVARAFYGRPVNGRYRARHRNGDLSDNRPENLVWWHSKGYAPPPRRQTVSEELDREYYRVAAARQELTELMQT